MKTQWDLSHFYTSMSDKEIESDISAIKRAYDAFAKKYQNKTDYLQNENALLKALQEYETLHVKASGKPLYYFLYIRELDSENHAADARLNKLSDELTHYENKVLFFTLNLGKISKSDQRRFLKSPKLIQYRYFLERLFLSSAYDLSEAEERILNLKSLTSHTLWVDGFEKTLNKQTVYFKAEILLSRRQWEKYQPYLAKSGLRCIQR